EIRSQFDIPPVVRLTIEVQPRPTRGELLKNSTRLVGCRRRAVNSSNCSAGSTTTASFPALVTYCGPSVRALRNSSLNRAFADCNCQVVFCSLWVLIIII